MGSPSLADESHQVEYDQLVGSLWDEGKISQSQNAEDALAQLGIAPDFEVLEATARDRSVMFLHRKLPDADIYFLTNRTSQPRKIQARFRMTGRRPELWHADVGASEPVSWQAENGRTIVPIELHPYQSVFVVFREPTKRTSERYTAPIETREIQLEGNWELSFESGRGAPEQSVVTRLESWTENVDPRVRYFSGICTYRKTFTLPDMKLMLGERIMLDLGEVYELAEVIFNGKLVGTAWHSPFRLEVSGALVSGTNVLEIRVANLWVNRLIGDQQPGATPIGFTVTSTYTADAPLRTSGLLGPVMLIRSAARLGGFCG
jgi:hypothetical protein